MKTPKSELMRKLRDERRKQGIEKLEIWAPKEAHERIKQYAKKFTAEKAAQ